MIIARQHHSVVKLSRLNLLSCRQWYWKQAASARPPRLISEGFRLEIRQCHLKLPCRVTGEWVSLLLNLSGECDVSRFTCWQSASRREISGARAHYAPATAEYRGSDRIIELSWSAVNIGLVCRALAVSGTGPTHPFCLGEALNGGFGIMFRTKQTATCSTMCQLWGELTP